MSTPLRRSRDAVVVILLLALPFFVLRSNVRDPRKLNALDRLIIRVSAPMQYVGALIRRITRSSAFRFDGAFILARRKKNGTARRMMTIPTSRYRLNADTAQIHEGPSRS